jgi:hypothetical protein
VPALLAEALQLALMAGCSLWHLQILCLLLPGLLLLLLLLPRLPLRLLVRLPALLMAPPAVAVAAAARQLLALKPPRLPLPPLLGAGRRRPAPRGAACSAAPWHQTPGAGA